MLVEKVGVSDRLLNLFIKQQIFKNKNTYPESERDI